MQICALQQPTYVSNKSPCQSQLCLDSWRLWLNSLGMRQQCQLFWPLSCFMSDVAKTTSKLFLENSGCELRNTPINAKSLFNNKIKEVAKSNYKAQQQRFLASSSTNIYQQQKSSYSATGAFKRPRQPNKSSRPKQSQKYRSKTQTQSFTSGTRKDFNKRSSNTKQFPSSKQASSSTKFWKPTLSTAYLTMPWYSSGRRIGPLWRTLGRIN